ncbi:NAD(P)-binding protein [Hypoxylon sp. FL1284]|nr:NAD(P)-binding protein [Hypoxylon sp. FL1284]
MEAPAPKPYTLPANAVWLITGCSAGIGEALATYVATKYPSQRVVATARNPASLSGVPNGPNVLKTALDVTSTASIAAAFDAALARFGRVDVVVNNAGHGMMGDTEASPEGNADARRLFDTNFWGVVDVTKRALAVFREDNAKKTGGVILNVSSVGAWFGSPGSAYYHASKYALEGFAESVARETKPEWGIHVCNLEPGGVATRFTTPASMRLLEPRHPAYAGGGTDALLAYMGDPNLHGSFSSAEAVAAAVCEVVGANNGGRPKTIPIRVPLGRDAWSIMDREINEARALLDEYKELSCSTGGSPVDSWTKLVE